MVVVVNRLEVEDERSMALDTQRCGGEERSVHALDFALLENASGRAAALTAKVVFELVEKLLDAPGWGEAAESAGFGGSESEVAAHGTYDTGAVMSRADQLFDAIRKGNAREVSKLLEEDRALIDAKKSGVSALLTAVYHRHPEIARLFIKRGAKLDIFEASAVGDAARLRQLLADDPSRVNAFAADGFTPLGLASFFGHPEAVRLLLERNADPNLASANAQRVAPLHSAVAGGKVEIVRELLARGADVNARQDLGFTALHGAAVEGGEETIRLLLDHGADPDAKNAAGKTPADLAREHGRGRAVEVLS
jgi:ankyrin repeat protein